MNSFRPHLSLARSLQRGVGWLVFASGSLVAVAALIQVQRLAH